MRGLAGVEFSAPGTTELQLFSQLDGKLGYSGDRSVTVPLSPGRNVRYVEFPPLVWSVDCESIRDLSRATISSRESS